MDSFFIEKQSAGKIIPMETWSFGAGAHRAAPDFVRLGTVTKFKVHTKTDFFSI
jgi:hypothetical protein